MFCFAEEWSMSTKLGIDFANILPYEKLSILGKENNEKYLNAEPFAHAYFDDIFDSKILDVVIQEFEGSKPWREFDTKYEKKLQMIDDTQMGPVTRSLIYHLNSAPFLSFLEDLTGIEGLIPDPYLSGGGLHQIPRGGKLGIHVDFNQYKKLNAYRRINVLVYLNKDWEEDYGGHLELWKDKQGSRKKKLLPIFNRMAIFSTVSNSFHGHPEPLNCPPDKFRRSLALYYYTAGDKGGQRAEGHSTIFITEKGKEDELGKVTFLGRIKRKLKKITVG
jgi:hypothetical protein